MATLLSQAEAVAEGKSFAKSIYSTSRETHTTSHMAMAFGALHLPDSCAEYDVAT